MRTERRIWPVAAAAVVLLADLSKQASAEGTVEFDLSVVQARGLDPGLAEYFRAAVRFPAGQHRVALMVNGSSVGQTLATFDEQGQLCLDATLLQQAGVDAERALRNTPGAMQCAERIGDLADLQVRLDPGAQQVVLLVPTRLLGINAAPVKAWASGGTAGVLNYNALITSNSGPAYSSQFRQLDLEWGFNAGDWVVRSRQGYTRSNQAEHLENLYTQASRTWARYGVNLQLGQLTLHSPLFAGGAFNGIQLLPEAALQRTSTHLGSGTRIEGIAYGPSRVEVRQSATVIYTTLVPAGPFVLHDLSLLSGQLDVEVSVIEDGTPPRRFWVPVSSLRQPGVASPPGFALAAGQTRRFADDKRDKPSFVVGSKDWLLGASTLLTAGWMGAEGYQSLGLGIQQMLASDTMLTAQHLNSKASSAGQGQSRRVGVNTLFGVGASAGLAWTQRSQGFRNLDDITLDVASHNPYARAEQQWEASLGYHDRYWGGLSSSVSQYRMAGERDRTGVSVSWSRTFGDVSLTLNVQRDNADDGRGTGIYTSVSMPLGQQRRVSASVRHDEGQGTRIGTRYTEQVNEMTSYSLSADRSDAGVTDLNARLSLVPRYTRVELGHSRGGLGQRGYDLALNGGLAIHKDGVTASPHALRDTFGLIKVGNQAGIKISTPQGPVWTDSAGHAVAASLSAFSVSRLEVEPRSLARNVEVLNGVQHVEAARGAVPRFEFALAGTQRLMLRVRTDTGEWLPKGRAVYDNAGAYLTTVVEAGLVYLADMPEHPELRVSLSDDERCVITLETGRVPDTDAPYQIVETRCKKVDV